MKSVVLSRGAQFHTTLLIAEAEGDHVMPSAMTTCCALLSCCTVVTLWAPTQVIPVRVEFYGTRKTSTKITNLRTTESKLTFYMSVSLRLAATSKN